MNPIEAEGQAGYVQPHDAPAHERADWCLRELWRQQQIAAAYQALADQSAAHWAAMIAKATAMAEALEAELAELTATMIAMLGDTTGRKSVDLPCGTVGFRSAEDWTWPDADQNAELLEWLLENQPDCVRRPEPKQPEPTPDKSAIKRHFKATGELPPMVGVARAERFHFTVSPGTVTGEMPPLPADVPAEEIPF